MIKTKLISPDRNSIVEITNGELTSYVKDGEELIHQKEKGWGSSDTEMFPIIGPTVKNNYEVETIKGNCFQDQHGLLRELVYQEVTKEQNSVSYLKMYVADTKVKNTKFIQKKSTQEYVSWPYSFNFLKTLTLLDDSLIIEFKFESEKSMPYMLGYHPAFKLVNEEANILAKGETITLKQVIDRGNSALHLDNISEINLIKPRGLSLNFKSIGFDNYTLWSPDASMVCIEPISQIPNSETNKYNQNNMKLSSGIQNFKFVITPFSQK